MAQPINDERFQATLHDYLTGELSPEGRAAFEERLATDPDARAEHAFSRRLHFANRHEDLLEAARVAGRVTASPPPTASRNATGLAGGAPVGSKWWHNTWLLGLLTILAVGLAFVGYRALATEPDAAQFGSLLAEPFLAEPLEPLLLNAAGEEAELAAAMDVYQAGDYARAAGLFSAYARRRQDPNAALYAGVSYLMLGENDLARVLLDQSAGRAEFPVSATAEYYALLARLRLGELDAAAATLARPAPGGLYEIQYEALRAQLNNR